VRVKVLGTSKQVKSSQILIAAAADLRLFEAVRVAPFPPFACTGCNITFCKGITENWAKLQATSSSSNESPFKTESNEV